MSWNYRVLRMKCDDGYYYRIHEVFYKTQDRDHLLWSEDAIEPHGETIKELKDDLKMMLDALDKPLMEETDDNKLKEVEPDEYTEIPDSYKQSTI